MLADCQAEQLQLKLPLLLPCRGSCALSKAIARSHKVGRAEQANMRNDAGEVRSFGKHAIVGGGCTAYLWTRHHGDGCMIAVLGRVAEKETSTAATPVAKACLETACWVSLPSHGTLVEILYLYPR